MKHLDPLVEVGHHGKGCIDSDRLCADIQRGNSQMVLHVQPCDYEGDELGLSDGFARHREFIRERAHVAEVR